MSTGTIGQSPLLRNLDLYIFCLRDAAWDMYNVQPGRITLENVVLPLRAGSCAVRRPRHMARVLVEPDLDFGEDWEFNWHPPGHLGVLVSLDPSLDYSCTQPLIRIFDA